MLDTKLRIGLAGRVQDPGREQDEPDAERNNLEEMLGSKARLTRLISERVAG